MHRPTPPHGAQSALIPAPPARLPVRPSRRRCQGALAGPFPASGAWRTAASPAPGAQDAGPGLEFSPTEQGRLGDTSRPRLSVPSSVCAPNPGPPEICVLITVDNIEKRCGAKSRVPRAAHSLGQ